MDFTGRGSHLKRIELDDPAGKTPGLELPNAVRCAAKFLLLFQRRLSSTTPKPHRIELASSSIYEEPKPHWRRV